MVRARFMSFAWGLAAGLGVLALGEPAAAQAPDFGLYGWATQGVGTTGGAGGTEVVVNNLTDFKYYANLAAPHVIKIYGTITGNEVVRVRSNKSILGVGSTARFLGVGLQIGWNSEFGTIGNVIIRNITFERIVYPNDAVMVGYGAKNVWIDHCNLFSDRAHGVDGYDGLVDVNHGADYVTVSWCKFYEHYKTSLVGNSDDTGAEDSGHLTVTYHHNSFDNSGGRNPSVRFGLVHVFNNHYRNLDDYAIASRMDAEVVVENNYFDNVNRPIRADTTLSPIAGFVRGEGTNVYTNCPVVCPGNSITRAEATWVPPYPYSLDLAEDVPTTVATWAGVGIVTWTGEAPPNPLTVNISGSGSVAVDPTPGPYPTGTIVTLAAVPQVGHQFIGWTGDLTGTLNPATLTMDSPKSVTARFESTVAQYTLSVSVVGSGSITRSPNAPTYAAGTVVILTQTPVAGGSFVGWSGDDCTGTDLTCTLTMNANKLVTATFTQVAPSVYLHDTFADGERATQALPGSAAWFTSSGSGNLTATTGELRQEVGSSRSLLAYFTTDQAAPVSLAAGQAVRLDFACTFTGFDSGAPVTDTTFRFGLLRGVPNPAAVDGTGFVATGSPNTNARVTGDFGGGAPASGVFSLYTGYAAMTAANTFGTSTPIRFYARTGTTTQLLSSTTPYTQVPVGTPTASIPMAADASYRGSLQLLHDGSGVILRYTLTRASDGAVIMAHSVRDATSLASTFDAAVFYLSKSASSPTYYFILTDVQVSRGAAYTLTTATAGTGTGSVAGTGISCGADCTELLSQGEVVLLTATSGAGSVFTGWTGDCSGTTPTCSVTMEASRSVTATFANAYLLTASTTGGGTGTITAPGLDCGGDCTERYAEGSVIAVTATATAGSIFAGWSGDCSGSALTCDVTMDSARSVTASFAVAHTLSVSTTGTGAGTITATGLDCGADCTESYAEGAVVTLTATPLAGSSLAAWGGACSGSTATCDVTIDADRSVSATFDEVPSYVFLHDTFADGERVTQSLPDSARWFTSSGSTNLTATPGAMTQAVSSSRTLLAHFTSSQDIAVPLAVGRALELGFTFRMTGFDTAGSADSFSFRAALLRSVANPAATVGTGFVPDGPPNTNARVTGDFGSNNPASAQFSLYTGYGAFTAANGVGTTTPIRFYARDGSAVNLLNSVSAPPFTQVPLGTPTASQPMAVDTAYRGTLRLLRGAAGTVLDYTLTRMSDGAVVMNQVVEESASAMTAFDTAAFYFAKTGSTGANYNVVFTDVEVRRRVVHEVTVLKLGNGSGAVAAAGMTCGTDCSEPYLEGALITLTATPSPGSSFTGWSGDCAGTSPTCDLTMDAARSAAATFTLNRYALTLNTLGEGSGSVTSSPAGISCGLDCTEDYDYGTIVTLTATPLPGSEFATWGGACSGSEPTCAATVDGAKSVSATFSHPSVSVGDITVGRTSFGTTIARFDVTLSTAPIETAAVDYATSDGTAIAATDYVATSGTLTFVPGETTKAVEVTVLGYPSAPNGTFFLDLNAPVNVAIADGQARASLTYGGEMLFTLPPCRILDTRDAAFAEPAIAAGSSRDFTVAGVCGVPATAKAVAVNVTATGGTDIGDLRLYPAGSDLPVVSALNYRAGQTRANNAVVALGTNGRIGVHCDQATGSVALILDVAGYFE